MGNAKKLTAQSGNEKALFAPPTPKKVRFPMFNSINTNHNKGKAGLLRHMSARQRQQAKALIRTRCSYYADGNCLALDKDEKVPCPQTISHSVNCKFFRDVLLNDEEAKTLKAVLSQVEALRRCAVCDEPFASASNNAKYCNDCKGSVQRSQKAAYARKRRLAVEK